ncbi:hypothetical protein ABZ934_07395 [Streptomyces sp. NPDC046557]|uniref:hypothetical protein n=1 Tax=Streptomyces sp. NPDC046557 TaxID=3155372 RepID=UPI0033F4AF75
MTPVWSDLPRMEQDAFDLSRLQLKVETSHAHPDGVCTRQHMMCVGCRTGARIATKYGGPMADCRICHFAWAVRHDPVHCWQRDDLPGGHSTGQGVL